MDYSSERLSNKYLLLNHCGIEHINQKDTCTIREKGRVDYHILYIAEGYCHTETLGVDNVVPTGGIILFKPHEKHNYRFFAKDASVSCYLHFTGNGCEEILNNIGFTYERIINIGKSHALESIFEKLVFEANSQQPHSENFCTAYLMEIFAIIGRRNTFSGNSSYLNHKESLNKVCRLMYNEHTLNYPLERYAQYCNLSISRFSHVFKSAFGVTPLEYITHIKVDKTIDLLVNSEYTISEIAEKIGFSSQNYLTRTFKKYTGVSPSKYRKLNLYNVLK